jgi:selenide,water dikinase
LPQLLPLLNSCALGSIEQARINCLLDPQTNGGFLIAAPEAVASEILATTDAIKIGEVCEKHDKAITLI